MILPGFMMPLGVEHPLDLPKGVVYLGAEHLLGEDTTHDAVAVFRH